MVWELKGDRPIYAQLIEQLQLGIIAGVFPPGSRMPAVRDLASEAAVNPNTMQKALSELERSGLLYTQRTAGRFVTEDSALIQRVKEEFAVEQIREFFEKMRRLGFTTEQTVRLVVQAAQKEDAQ